MAPQRIPRGFDETDGPRSPAALTPGTGRVASGRSARDCHVYSPCLILCSPPFDGERLGSRHLGKVELSTTTRGATIARPARPAPTPPPPAATTGHFHHADAPGVGPRRRECRPARCSSTTSSAMALDPPPDAQGSCAWRSAMAPPASTRLRPRLRRRRVRTTTQDILAHAWTSSPCPRRSPARLSTMRAHRACQPMDHLLPRPGAEEGGPRHGTDPTAHPMLAPALSGILRP